jgi:hypothetical protein
MAVLLLVGLLVVDPQEVQGRLRAGLLADGKDPWHSWQRAFDRTESHTDHKSDGRLHMNDINELFKAHYILEYGEEEHKMASQPDVVDDHGTAKPRPPMDVFLQEAANFRTHIESTGTPGVIAFSFKDFKIMLLEYMHNLAYEQMNARSEL